MEKGQLLDGMKAGARLKRAVFPYSIQQRFSDKYDSKNGGFCDSRWLQGFAEINLQARAKRSAGTTTLWQMGLHSPDALISLGCCPMDVEIRSAICSKNNASASSPVSHDLVLGSQSARDIAQKQTMTETMNGDYSTEHKQNDKVGSAMTGEFKSSVMGVSENRREPKWEEVPLQDLTSTRSMEKNRRDLERMESGITMVSGSGGVSDGCEDLRRYLISMEQAGKLPSSQFKGVVPQPNGRWGAQIYEKHQRVWLGTFNAEDDAARAYDRAAVKFRGRGTMTNFSSVGSGDPEAVFMKEHTKEEIVDMLRKHTYNEEFQHHSKKIMAAAAPSAAMNSAEASRWEGSCLRAHDSQENRAAIDAGNWNATSFAASMEGLPREYLFDKTVTPSDVGKLNRLVIPKQQAEKHFPLDGNSTEKGLLLDFEDNMGKVWQFRYSYWNSSQSYVLTKGWSRFVKDKKLEAGDIISFHRGSAQPQQLYISSRRRPLGQPQLGVGPHFGQSKGRVVYPFKGSSLLNSFKSGTQATVVNNAQWMPIFWPSSSNPDVFKQFNSHSVSPLVKEVNRVDAVWFNGALPFSFSAPSTKQTVHQRFFDINSDGLQPMNLHLALHNSVNPGDGSNDIRPLNPFVNSAGSSVEREPETPEHKAASSIDPAIKKGVRLFGVTLAEGKR